MKKTNTLRKIGAFIVALPLLFFVEMDNLKFNEGQQKPKQVINAQNTHHPRLENSGYDTSFPVFINSKFIILNY